jgi:hypothetical protein
MDLATAVPLLIASGLIVAARMGPASSVLVLMLYVLVCNAPVFAIMLIPRAKGS